MLLRIVVFVMMAVGLLGFGTVAWLSLQPPAVASTGADGQALKHTVLVAARDLQAGALLKPDDISVAEVTTDKVPENSSSDTPDARRRLIGSMVRRRLSAGEGLLPADLLRPGDHGFLAAVLATGMRAVTIGVDAITGTAGLIWPGDHVDVVLTQQVDDPARPVGHRTAAETVLQDTRVIAIDQQLVQGANPGSVEAKPATTVTLEVTSLQAERVSVATRLGKLSLVVRAAVSVDPGSANPPAQPASNITWGSDVSPALDGSTAPPPPAIVKVYGGTNNGGQEYHF